MGRTHPTYCEHGKMIDAGSFEGLTLDRCEPCEAERFAVVRWLAVREHIAKMAADQRYSDSMIGIAVRNALSSGDQ